MLLHSKIARGGGTDRGAATARARRRGGTPPPTRGWRQGEEEERAECRGTDDVVGNLHQQRGQMARHDDGGAAGYVAAAVVRLG